MDWEKYKKAALVSMFVLSVEELNNFPYEALSEKFIKNIYTADVEPADPSIKNKMIEFWHIRVEIALNYKNTH